jgi:pyridoxal phosphate enzyme (YggS family)
MSDLAANIESVRERMGAAASRAGRNVADITLVAVTKTHPIETVVAAYQAGLRHFGENRVAEGRAKVAAMADWLTQARLEEPLEPPTWHMIGHLQRRQVGEALGQFELIHSVDSLRLAERIQRLAVRGDYPPVKILLECNVSGESAKSGFELDRWHRNTAQFRTFLAEIARIAALDKLIIRGLMTMAPLTSDPEETRPTFQSLAALRQRLQIELAQLEWQHLSMGMTDDFEVAIEEGATMIRVGRALFGERLQ